MFAVNADKITHGNIAEKALHHIDPVKTGK